MNTDGLKATRARLVAELEDLRERLTKGEKDLSALDRVLTMLSASTVQPELKGIIESSHTEPKETKPKRAKMVIPQNLPLQKWMLEAIEQIKGDFDRTMLVAQISKNHPDRANEIRVDSVGAILGKLTREKSHGIVKVSGGVGKGANFYHSIL